MIVSATKYQLSVGTQSLSSPSFKNILFFSEFPILKTCNFIKKRLKHRYFPINIDKFLKLPILKNICERLFLPPLPPQCGHPLFLVHRR